MKLWIAAPAAWLMITAPAWAQDHQHQHGQPAQQQEPAPPAQQQEPAEHQHQPGAPAQQQEPSEHQHQPAPPAAEPTHDHGGPQVRSDFEQIQLPVAVGRITEFGALGFYSMSREASGTAWQPDASSHGGVHANRGDWLVMGHALFNSVYAWSDGPRGDEKAFLAGMVMGLARRNVGNGTINFRVMMSPDPFMGRDGYPLLFAAGESADGVTLLVDRQHPHDLFMELSASYSHRFGDRRQLFAYVGLPGEPAFGPPSFMHRMSAMDSPEAPISHHWFDSTHITFGVLTAGYIHHDWKVEASQFRGREPDEDRYDIETGALDSTAVRVSWNPNENWSLQASWADISSPEALEPDEDEERWSVSAIYTRRIGEHGWWSGTLAFSNKERSDGVSLDAWLAEAAWHPNDAWTVFARGEAIETDELGAIPHGPVEDVARLSAGVIHDWRVSDNAVFGVGALVQAHYASDALEPLYGGDPEGAMGFVRLKIG